VAEKAFARVPPRVSGNLTTRVPSLLAEAQFAEMAIVGDHSGVDAELIEAIACRFDGVQLTGSRLARDCMVTACDLSGAVFEDSSFRRVEFRGCRLSGVQAQHSLFKDVAFFDCKMDGANLKMTEWEAAELQNCALVDADFYEASLPGCRLEGCDLSGVQLSKADLTGVSLRGSVLERIQGAESLRGVTIGSDQVIPTALVVFGALNIVVDDDF
jgi:uncharacterized protein YjbI with pentapeptide repeats